MKLLNRRNIQIINTLLFILLVSTTYVCISFYYSKDLAKTNAKRILKNSWLRIDKNCNNNNNIECIKENVKKIKKTKLKLSKLECYFCYGEHDVLLKLYSSKYVNENLYELGLENVNSTLQKRQKKSSEKFKFLAIPTFNKEYFSFIKIKNKEQKVINYLFIEYDQRFILYNIISKLIIFIIIPSIVIISFIKNNSVNKEHFFSITLGSRFFGLFFLVGIIIYRFMIELFFINHFSYISINFNEWIHNMINLNKNVEFIIYFLFVIISFVGTLFIIKSLKNVRLSKKNSSTFFINCLQFIAIVLCIYKINNNVEIDIFEIGFYILSLTLSIYKIESQDIGKC